MTERKEIRRGDIFIYDFGNERNGSVQAGRRPVMVVQCNDISKKSPTVTVAAMSSAVKKLYLPTHVMLDEKTGLDYPTIVMLEQMSTVNESELGKYIGSVSDKKQIKRIDEGLLILFGLAEKKKYPEESIRCLCPSCASDYRVNGDYILRRVDPFTDKKDLCTRCNRGGYDYFVIRKGGNR